MLTCDVSASIFLQNVNKQIFSQVEWVSSYKSYTENSGNCSSVLLWKVNNTQNRK